MFFVGFWFTALSTEMRGEQGPAYWRNTALGELNLLGSWVFLLKTVALTETLATITLLLEKKNSEVSLPELVHSSSLLFPSRPESSI